MKILDLRVSKWICMGIIALLWLKAALLPPLMGESLSHVVTETGELGWYLLVFTIYVSLLQKLVRLHMPKVRFLSKLLPLRKYTGVFAFLVLTTHMVVELFYRGVLGDGGAMWAAVTSLDSAERIGFIGYVIMLPLFLTSTNWAVRKMGGKAWKMLQRLAHVVFIFAALHIALIDYFVGGGIEMDSLIVIGVYVLGYLYLWSMRFYKARITITTSTQ